jgi:HK97 family phage major capsid protein
MATPANGNHGNPANTGNKQAPQAQRPASAQGNGHTQQSQMDQLAQMARKNAEGLEVVTKGLVDVVNSLKNSPGRGTPSPGQVFGTPNVREGENIMGSRGFSFTKMLGVITGVVPPNEAKIEIDIHNRLHNGFCNSNLQEPYQYRGGTIPGEKSFLAPLATSFMQDNYVPRSFRHEMKALLRAGADGADFDEMKWIRQQQWKSLGYNVKTLSWINELTGGALVAPPEQGELIELLRNREACVNAGARVVPLPPQGRMRYPRQTAASLTYWVGENQQITASDIGTGDISLQAKKLAVLIKAPNELIRFASPAAEALMRDDMTKSLALGLDLACLEGAGGDNMPKGIINYQNINRITSGSTAANGDQIIGQDIYRFISAVEESNAEFEGWIMRPKTLYKYYQLRSDAVAQGDAAGPFLFSLIREPGDGADKPMLAGYPVTKSTQVSQSRTKGGSTNLTYIVGGMWSDMLIGMFGALEFSATTMGDTAFQFDQTWVKGILSADTALRHDVSFVLMDQLIVGQPNG